PYTTLFRSTPGTRARTSALRYAARRPTMSWIIGTVVFFATTTPTCGGGIASPAPALASSPFPQADRMRIAPATASVRAYMVMDEAPGREAPACEGCGNSCT